MMGPTFALESHAYGLRNWIDSIFQQDWPIGDIATDEIRPDLRRVHIDRPVSPNLRRCHTNDRAIGSFPETA
jgi:hypothetical protein